MNFYILTNLVENEKEDAVLGGFYKDKLNNEYDLESGSSLTKQKISTPLIFNFHNEIYRGEMNDHLSLDDITGPIFSLRTKLLFEKNEITNIEYYQLTLIDEFPPGKKADKNDTDKPKPIEYTNYFIANVVGLVDCVDHEKSVLEYFYPPELRDQKKEEPNKEDDINDPFAGENPNDIDFITKLVLDESKIDPQLKVFRLKDQPNLLIFHESIVELIRKEKLSGFVFVPVSKYTDAIEDDEEETDNEESKQTEAAK